MGILILLAAGAATCMALGTASLCHTMLRPRRRTFASALGRGMAADPADLGLPAQAITFRFGDGAASPGWVLEGGCPEGPLFVISHGWGSSRYMGLHRAAMLRPLASGVVLYDMRGHGDSTAAICRLGTTEVDDLMCVLEQLPALPGAVAAGQSIVLLGSSLGAGVSIAAAARAGPYRVAAVVAEGTCRHLAEPVGGYLRVRGHPALPLAPLACLCVRTLLGGFGGFDRAAHAARLRVPLLVLHGTLDPLCPLESARQIAAAAPDGQIVEFEAGGHGGLAAVDTPRYLGAIEGLCAKVRRQAAMPHVAEATAAVASGAAPCCGPAEGQPP